MGDMELAVIRYLARALAEATSLVLTFGICLGVARLLGYELRISLTRTAK